MNIFGGFPTQSESFTNEYGENITVYYGKFSFIIDVMIASFWIVVGFNCFKRNYKIAGIGTILRLIACCLSLINYWEYSRLSSSETDYYQAKQILGVCGIMGYASTLFIILGILLIVLKGRISTALKTAFILFPIVRVIATDILMGYNWYTWIEILYAVGLTIWSFIDKTDKSELIETSKS